MKFIYLSIIACGLLLMSCNKTETPTPVGKTFMVNASSFTNWVYFSFAKGDTIQVSNTDTSTAWDLSFQRFAIKTNSGASGNGSGGAYNSGKTGTNGFESLITVPELAVFTVDSATTLYGEQGSPENLNVNTLLSNWYNYDTVYHKLPSKNLIYIIRTATNKYAKLLIDSYYNPKDPNYLTTGSGYITITYFYQQNGSKTLQ